MDEKELSYANPWDLTLIHSMSPKFAAIHEIKLKAIWKMPFLIWLTWTNGYKIVDD